MMDSSVHTASCAFLVCAEAFLSQGIEKLVKERHPNYQNLASEDVCRLCCAVVNAQSKDLLLNLNTLFNRYECDTSEDSLAFVKTDHEILQDKSISSNLYTSFCQEAIGKHGRSLVVNHSIGRGHILLKESPYAAVKAGHCACSVGNVLTEHITLATAIQQSKATSPEKHTRFLKSFYSGLTSKTVESTRLGSSGRGSAAGVTQYKHRPSASHTADSTTAHSISGDNITRTGSNAWHLRTQILMALVCAIRSLYRAHTEHTAHYGPLSDYTSLTSNNANNTSNSRPTNSTSANTLGVDTTAVDRRERLFKDTWQLLQVLSRLPHNTHAVSSVVSSKQGVGQSSTSTREVQQVRLGYAVFLHASSINHSCHPNANIRYTTLPYTVSSTADATPYAALHGVPNTHSTNTNNTNTTSMDPALQYLRNVQIEIVSTTSIPSLHPSASEVCVSYGPLHGVHSVVQRRSVLRDQYLFACECAACIADSEAQHRSNTTSSSSSSGVVYPIDTNATTNEQIDQVCNATLHSVAPLVHSTVQHIHAVSHVIHDTTYLSTTLTLLKQQLAELNSLFTTVVHHVQSDPHNVPLLMSFESKKLKPIADKISYLQRTYYTHDMKITDTQVYDTVVCGSSVYKCDALYIDYCAVYCTYLDIYAHIYALQSDYTQASVHINYAITLMVRSGMYQPLDVVIGRERVKLAGVLLSAGNKRTCGVQVKCALDVLVPVVSRDDPDVVEAKHMLAFCRA